MGIREQGYRHWQGQYTSHYNRWWTIAKQGMRATVFNRWRLVFLLFATFVIWAPFLVGGIGSYFAGAANFGFECTSELGGVRSPGVIVQDRPLQCNLYDLLRGWQFLVVPIYIGAVAAPLVSSDLRSNAMYIYLSKPLRRTDYILGKSFAVAAWGVPVTILPALFLWLMVYLSTNPVVQLEAAGTIFFRALWVEFVFLALLTTLALAVSSFTKNWYYSLLSFLGTYFSLWVIANLLRATTRKTEYYYLSIVDNVWNFAEGVYDVPAGQPAWWPSVLIVFGLIGVGAFLFVFRIRRLEVAE